MNHKSDNHLDHDRFLMAIVDLSGLAEADQKHLSDCSLCKNEMERIRSRFEQLGNMARTMTPDHGSNIRINPKRFKAGKYRLWRYRAPLFAAVTVMMFICSVLWISPYHGPLPDPVVAVNNVSRVEKAGLLMEEIDILVKNPLPLAYQRLAEVLDQEEDEDMMNFVVPSVSIVDTANS